MIGTVNLIPVAGVAGMAVWAVVGVLLFAGLTALFRPPLGGPDEPAGPAEEALADWAAAAGYDLLAVSPDGADKCPLAATFGTAWLGHDGTARRVTVMAADGGVRRGWAYVAARRAGDGPAAEFVEVAWDA